MRKLHRAVLTIAALAAMVSCSDGEPRPAPSADQLLTAAAAGDTAAVQRLVEEGAPLDGRDAQGRTALLAAIEGAHVDAALALIQRGADINAQAANLDTPWLLAGARGHADVLAAMIPRRPDLSIRNRFGGNALIPACERAHVEAVRVLLTSGIDINHVNNLGWTCLLEIVILGNGQDRHQEVTRLVLGAGANPNIADRDGVTPLAHAQRRNQPEVAALIAAAGGR